MSNPNDYTVGWICAITTEYVAAQEFLDEEHDGPEYVSPNDNNHYTLGRVGKHNVVIAVLPDNEYGKSSAAGVARDMMHSFPNVRIGLMVGIGGGAPGNHDIRLGDVVVSSGTNNGGVLGYDFGKNRQGHDFEMTGFLNQPPTLLRAAMSGLKARYERRGHQISQTVDAILKNNKRLQKKYKQPESATDQLFKSEVTHDSSCKTACRYDEANLVSRPERDKFDDYPVIHYGLIGSADTLMKSALARDRVSEAHDILCFEMEAAGLMNHFPCLVIRGICDYSDSHKNKKWQGYAAMAAAAYAKDLLGQIAPNRVEAERKIRDILSGFQEVAKEHCDIAKEQLQAQKDLTKERLSDEQRKCHQLFRLTTGSRDATYEWYKSRVEERVEDTCMWFLEHDNFQAWLNQESGPLLVSADPGCGKSVLAKYLIDHGLPRSSVICYFFFKDQDQNTGRQALCALLHQLFSIKPSLIDHAMSLFRMNGQDLINSTELLWEILMNSVQDPRAGSIILVLDALDECANSEFVDLVRNVKGQFSSGDPRFGKLRYLLTCRPYDQILGKFHDLLEAFPNIHIPGEEESEAISREINHVIKCRIDQLATERRLSPQTKRSLGKKLQSPSHRTYLWVHLVFDYLADGNFKKTPTGIISAIASLPRSVNEAYEKILNKAKEAPMVRKALCIILAANQPLTIWQMNVAVNVDGAVKSFDDLDLEDDEEFRGRLRSWCGLFVSIHHGKIYLLHQTAREFLLADLQSPTNIPLGLHWHHSISNSHAHNVLAEICVLYLNLLNSDASLPLDANPKPSQLGEENSFLYYSARNWAAHLRKADITGGATIIPIVRRICDTDSKSYSKWFNIYRDNRDMVPHRGCTDLILASYMGLPVIVKQLLEQGAEIEARDHHHPQSLTSLSWATREGHEGVVKLLLEMGADVNTRNSLWRETPLFIAARKGHLAMVDLLLEKGADINAENDIWGQTPLYIAAREGHLAIVDLLLEKGADPNADNNIIIAAAGSIPLGKELHAAWKKGPKSIIELLSKVDISSNNAYLSIFRKHNPISNPRTERGDAI